MIDVALVLVGVTLLASLVAWIEYKRRKSADKKAEISEEGKKKSDEVINIVIRQHTEEANVRAISNQRRKEDIEHTEAGEFDLFEKDPFSNKPL